MNNKRVLISVLILFLITLLSFVLIYENKNMELNTYNISSEKIPEEFESFRIVHISDLHNTEFGENNSNLIDMISKAEPDIIVITGDIIDSRRTDIEISLRFTEEALKIAPCYYVNGNHEARVSDYSIFKEIMSKAGVTILENQTSVIDRSGSVIEIKGICDPSFSSDYLLNDESSVVDSQLKEVASSNKNFTVLLSHRPEFFDIYANYEIDLVLSGHTHAGQFIFPFLGGFIAPSQGFFPEYDSGLFEQGNTKMIISRGLGNSIIPLRVNNRPEVILIELHSGC